MPPQEPDRTIAAKAAHRHRRFIPSARSNLPDWPAEPPDVDTTGRGFILIGLGSAAASLVARWRTEGERLQRSVLEYVAPRASADAATLSWLDEALASAVVGWRLMLAGPASELLVLAARARAAGLIEDEIRAFALDDGHVRIHCIHCGAQHRIVGAPGSVVPCPDCGRRLFIHQHLSRRYAALLAFISDFETSP